MTLNRSTTAAALWVVAGSMFAGSTAHAAAWTLPAGQSQIIASTFATTSDGTFDADGRVAAGPTFNKTEIYLLAEHGITDTITASVTPSLSWVTEDGRPLSGNGLGYIDLALRDRIAGGDTGPLSVQATLRVPGNRRVSPLSQVAAQGIETDLRILMGRSLALGRMNAFVDLQAGYRFRSGAPANDFHLDATVGLQPAKSFRFLLQSFATLSDGPGTSGFPSNRFANVAGSAVYDVSPRVSLQLGFTGTVAGRNALRERGGQITIWLRP